MRLARPATAKPGSHDIFGIEREEVRHRHATATPERQVRTRLAVLQPEPRDVVGGHRRTDRGVADRQPADLRGRRHVALEERGRHWQHVRVVVEAIGHVVGRQQRAPIDLQRQQVPDHVRVFGSVETSGGGSARTRPGGRGLVNRRFEPGGKRLVGRRLWTRSTGRRHRARPQLPNDLFPGVRVSPDMIEVVGLEREASSLQPAVVAGDAVAVEHRPVVGGNRGASTGVGLLRGRRERTCADQQGADEACQESPVGGLSHRRSRFSTS